MAAGAGYGVRSSWGHSSHCGYQAHQRGLLFRQEQSARRGTACVAEDSHPAQEKCPITASAGACLLLPRAVANRRRTGAAFRRRQFICHPATIPIEARLAGLQADEQFLQAHCIGIGRLAFRCAYRVEPGALVHLRIPHVAPEFESDARVVWCWRHGKDSELAVEFLNSGGAYKARMGSRFVISRTIGSRPCAAKADRRSPLITPSLRRTSTKDSDANVDPAPASVAPPALSGTPRSRSRSEAGPRRRIRAGSQ